MARLPFNPDRIPSPVQNAAATVSVVEVERTVGGDQVAGEEVVGGAQADQPPAVETIEPPGVVVVFPVRASATAPVGARKLAPGERTRRRLRSAGRASKRRSEWLPCSC